MIRNLAYCWLRLIRCIMEVRIFIRLHLIHNELCFMQIVDMLIFPNRDSAAKKAKFFFHPDKLPKDLTENQTQLMKILWG